MTNLRSFSASFAGGEMAPEMFSRLADVKYQSGAARLRNFIVKPTGPVQRRPGFQFVRAVKDSTKAVRLIPFTYSTDETFAIELGDEYARFHTDGGTLTVDPADYVPDKPFTAVASDQITLASHSFTVGMPIEFTAGAGTLPSPLVVGAVYYAIYVDSTHIKVATTVPNAIAGTAITLGAVVGTCRVHYYYTPGDAVLFTNGYVCVQNPTQPSGSIVPGGDPLYWHLLTLDSGPDWIYEIPTPYDSTDLFAINYVQSNDVLTLVHPDYPPAELSRLATTKWQHADIEFETSIAAPSNVTVTATFGEYQTVDSLVQPASGACTFDTINPHFFAEGLDTVYLTGLSGSPHLIPERIYVVFDVPTPETFRLRHLTGGGEVSSSAGAASYPSLSSVYVRGTVAGSENSQVYVVTAVDEDGVESDASAEVTSTNNLFANGASNYIDWDAVTGAKRYRVYKKQSGLFGYIGESSTAAGFKDDNISPDLGVSPPLRDTSLSGTTYPDAVTYFEGRRVFAKNQQVWLTRSGTESDLSYSIPTKDDDRISFQIAAREASVIRHAVPLQQLLLLTNSGEYRVTPVNSDAITPSSVAVRPQSFIGCSTVRPIVANATLVYAANRGGHIREMGYSTQAESFVSGDLSLRASHLFDGFEVVDSAISKSPHQVLWWVSSSGYLLGLTYAPEEQIGGWHWHDTDGAFESCCAIPDGDEDRLYAVVRRTINGSTVRYIERMAAVAVDAVADCFYVDAGATYSGAAATTISGLTHLVGETVAILADGVVVAEQTVSASGTVTLSTAATKVHVGLPYQSDLQTMPLALQIDGFGQGRNKNLNKVWLRVVESGKFYLGPNSDNLVPSDAYSTGGLVSTQVEVRVTPSWALNGSLWVQMDDPLPLTVVGLTMEVAIG